MSPTKERMSSSRRKTELVHPLQGPWQGWHEAERGEVPGWFREAWQMLLMRQAGISLFFRVVVVIWVIGHPEKTSPLPGTSFHQTTANLV